MYRARDARLERDVASKVLPPSFFADGDRLARFQQEARATAAHDRGIVHRDLKPENVFITSDGLVKILDFGLAKLTQPAGIAGGVTALPTRPALTGSGTVLGTLGYMAPEQIRGLTSDHRADLFAFGAVLYEMVSGTRAFTGATAADTMTAILTKDPAEPTTSGLSLSPALDRVIRHCVEKAPEERFQSARDLIFALRNASTSSHASGVTQASSATRGRRISWPLVLAGTMSVVALFAISRLMIREPTAVTAVQRFEITLPDVCRYNQSHLALSPDGRYLAFVDSTR